jgi:hypothetical protein
MQSCHECKGSICLLRSNGKHGILLHGTKNEPILCQPFLPPFNIIRCAEDVEKVKAKVQDIFGIVSQSVSFRLMERESRHSFTPC